MIRPLVLGGLFYRKLLYHVNMFHQFNLDFEQIFELYKLIGYSKIDYCNIKGRVL